MIMKRIAWVTLSLVGILWAEPSVYTNAGSSNPQIKRNRDATYRLKQETARLREEIEGLRSIIEGLNRTVGRLRQGSSSTTRERKLLDNMGTLLDKINRNYVTKAELSRALKKGHFKSTPQKKTSVAVAKKSSTKKSTEKKSSNTGNNLNKAPASALYSKGVRLINKQRYAEAEKRFEILVRRGYKAASSHFYLGEVAYHKGKFSRAVDQYKQSAELNENAEYMDKLLLHTGLSLEKSGDKAQAKRFFQAIIDGYPDTVSAAVAKRHL